MGAGATETSDQDWDPFAQNVQWPCNQSAVSTSSANPWPISPAVPPTTAVSSGSPSRDIVFEARGAQGEIAGRTFERKTMPPYPAAALVPSPQAARGFGSITNGGATLEQWSPWALDSNTPPPVTKEAASAGSAWPVSPSTRGETK